MNVSIMLGRANLFVLPKYVTDVVLEAVNLIGIDNLTLHDQRRLLDNGHASLAKIVGEDGRLVGLGSADSACIVGSSQFTRPSSPTVPTTVAGVG